MAPMCIDAIWKCHEVIFTCNLLEVLVERF